jgi:hypothetical protein
MHRFSIVALAFACSAAAAHAQNPNQTRTPTGAPPAPSRGGNQTVMMTGCVAAGDRTTTPSPGAGEFVLANARMSNDSATGTAQPSREDPRTAAGAGTAAPDTANQMKLLLSGESSTLRPHLGHQVEVTGRIDSKEGMPSGVTGTTGNPTVSTTASSTTGLEQGSDPSSSVKSGAILHVESVRMIAATCPSAK